MAVAMADQLSGGQCWHLNPRAVLHWRQFDGDWVVHDTRSGMTNQLDVLHATVLMAYEAGTVMGLADLQRCLATEFGLADLGPDALHDLVTPLCQLHLLLPAPPPTDAAA